MRITLHNGRRGQGSARHNARDYDTHGDAHLHNGENVYYVLEDYQSRTYAKKAFSEQDERDFYWLLFERFTDDSNARALRAGHKERVISTDDYYDKHPPEESLVYFGDKDTAPSRESWIFLFEDYLERYRTRFPHVPILDAAIHFDEEGAPHAHIRRIYIDDTSSTLKIGRFKALLQDGFTNTRNKRYDNNKVDFTASERQLIQDVARDHGYSIETEPRSISGLTLDQYKVIHERNSIVKNFIKENGLQEQFVRFF